MYFAAGAAWSKVSRRRSSVVFVSGWETRRLSCLKTRPSSAFIGGMRRSTGAPTVSASLSVGSAAWRALTPGRSRLERSAKSTRKGRCSRSATVPWASVGTPLEIASLSASGSAERAAKVADMFAKFSAFWSETGATSAAVRASAGKKRSRRVSGAVRMRETGFR